MEAIILAGGLGTRLRGVIGEAPKCMAPVAGQPFLAYLFRYLEKQGCQRCVLSLGYKHEAVLAWLEQHPPSFKIKWVIEKEALGTGGGIRLALSEAKAPDVVILNGDTLFHIDLSALLAFHQGCKAETTVALKALRNFDRYGTVTTAADAHITAFTEKAPTETGMINGGIYCIRREAFLSRPFPTRFSFEQDYLERHTKAGLFFGWQSTGYFIDIGVPSDYERAQTEIPELFTQRGRLE